jgi:cytochrome c556
MSEKGERMKKVALLAVTMLATAAVARAEIDPILTRQAGMDLTAGTLGGINNIVKLKGDVKTIENPAKYIQKWAAVIPSLFPPGSDKAHTNKAKPEIWSDNAKFMSAAANLGDAAGKLSEAAKSGDVDTVSVAIKGVSDACANCHNTFRAK